MAHITPGNRLYLYQLLSRELGVGKQTILSRVEEVLAADDIMPCDLGCADVRELLAALDDFIRLSVFKKGRAYATVIAQPAWDELLAHAGDAEAEKAPAPKGGPKSWKRKRSAKNPKPAKPRPKGRPKPTPEPEPELEPAPDPTQGSEPVVVPEQVTVAEAEVAAKAEVVAKPEVAQEPAPADVPEAAAEAASASDSATGPEDAQEPEPMQESEPAREPEPARELEPTSKPVPEAPRTPSITFTVTYDPYADEAEESQASEEAREAQESLETHEAPEVREAQEARKTPEVQHAPHTHEAQAGPQTPGTSVGQRPQQAPTPAPVERTVPLQPQAILPHRFANEVVCRNTVLSALYQILPFDVDPIALLDEDWRIARSTESYAMDGSSVVFPLRYLHEDGGEPLRMRMRRKPRTVSGKRWELTGMADIGVRLDQIGFDGLPAEDDGAWSELVAGAQIASDFVTPTRLLALFAHLGPWSRLLAALADLAAPEPWGADNEVLQEYLTLTFYRVMQQDLLATAGDLSWAAFDTGLLTTDGQSIYMRFRAGTRDNPWEFQSFSTEAPQPTPQPATYVTQLDDITFAAPYTVRTSNILARTYGDELRPALDVAVRRARRNYRSTTPAYDPRADRLRLLAPIQLDGDTRALVLAPQPQGGYLATAILALDRARACARVVTSDLPAWLG